MKYSPIIAILIILLFAVHFLACNGGPPPPECGENEELVGDVCECVEGYERNDAGDCVEEVVECGENEFMDRGGVCQCIDGFERNEEGVCVEVPPVTCEDRCAPYQGARVNGECRCSSDYYVMKKAESLHAEAVGWDARLIGNGVRGPQWAFANCGDSVLPYNGYESWDEIHPVTVRALEAKIKLFGPEGDEGFYSRLLIPNRHFGEGRSTVYKPEAAPWFSEARHLLNGTGTESNPNGPVSKLDGIKGKCQEILEGS